MKTFKFIVGGNNEEAVVSAINFTDGLRMIREMYPDTEIVHVIQSSIEGEVICDLRYLYGFEYIRFVECKVSCRFVDLKDDNLTITFYSCIISDLLIENSTISNILVRSCFCRKGDIVSISSCNIHSLEITDSFTRRLAIKESDIRFYNFAGSSLRNAIMAENAKGRGMNLAGTDISCSVVDFSEYDNVYYDFRTIGYANSCPEEGTFIGYKKLDDNKIATLLIPKDAKRSSGTSGKCRASKVKVLKIEDKCGKQVQTGESIFYNAAYQKGKVIESDGFDENRWNECSNGIHFFMDKTMAKNYYDQKP